MFAANKQIRDSTALPYQIAGILLLMSNTVHIWYLSKHSDLTIPKNISGVIKWNMLNFMSIVYICVYLLWCYQMEYA